MSAQIQNARASARQRQPANMLERQRRPACTPAEQRARRGWRGPRARRGRRVMAGEEGCSHAARQPRGGSGPDACSSTAACARMFDVAARRGRKSGSRRAVAGDGGWGSAPAAPAAAGRDGTGDHGGWGPRRRHLLLPGAVAFGGRVCADDQRKGQRHGMEMELLLPASACCRRREEGEEGEIGGGGGREG